MTYFQSLFMTRFAAGLSEATESGGACESRSTDARLNAVHEKRFCEKPALCLRRLRIVACFALACGVMRATDLTTDLTLVARPGPRQLLSLSSDFVLDWDPPTGTHNIWKYNPALSGQTDPLPGNPVVTGAWSSIRTGHELVYLGKGVVLDWQPLTGAYRLWQYDSTLTGAVDPFSSAAITSGTWSSIRTGHKLVYLGPVGGGSTADRVLDWEPGTGHYRLWIYDRSVTGHGDPFPGSPVTQGTWASVHVGHELISLEGGRVLDWEPQSGHYRVWGFNPNAKVDQDPLPAPPHNEGTWGTVHLGHELLLLQGRQRVLDWEPIAGRNRVWSYDSRQRCGRPTAIGHHFLDVAGHSLKHPGYFDCLGNQASGADRTREPLVRRIFRQLLYGGSRLESNLRNRVWLLQSRAQKLRRHQPGAPAG